MPIFFQTASEGEALILSMYTNYFDGTACIGF